jgi:KDO2-lipid IV(A) lauroyltransferase
MYKELQDKKQNALLLSLREQQDLYMAAANKKGVLKLPVPDRMFTGLTFNS